MKVSAQHFMALAAFGGVLIAAPQMNHQGMQTGPRQAVAVMIPTDGNLTGGVVEFTQTPDGVRVVGWISGLKPNQRHGFHVHEFGDMRKGDGTGMGSHYNPENHPHALPNTEDRHAGDLGNLEADARGKAYIDKVFKGFTIGGSENPILGRGLVIHAQPDDGGQPTGNAGDRISYGVVAVAENGD